MSQPLLEIIDFLNAELRVSEIPDYPNAWNGLQIANSSGRVTKVAVAVDGAKPSLEAAVAAGASLLIVHHGLFWSGVQMITGSVFQKLKLALDHDLAVYSAHLPLDFHPTLGNDVLLAKACGLEHPEVHGDDRSRWLVHVFHTDQDRAEFAERVRLAVGGGRVHLAPGGPDRVRKVAVATGGAGSEVAKIVALGADTFLTGEGPHHTFTLAEELGVNLFYAGHYATETFGVKALGALLKERFGLEWTFLDHPTGL